jgi:ribonuclease HI
LRLCFKKTPFECILHTLPAPDDADELSLMRTLYQLGFEKAVILDTVRHSSGILEITFKESTGDLLSAERKQKTLPPWPPPQKRTQRKHMYQVVPGQHAPACCLNCGVTSEDLFKFFQSSKNTLCTSFEGIDLPDFCHERLRGLAAHTHFDRLIIYTDGSSQSRLKHISPLLNEEIGIPDSWSFLVLGETYLPDGGHELTLIGWSAHQVRCDPNNDWYIGADRTGSAIAEREALCWALLWRIGQNSNIPTVLRSDSMLALQQAKGDIGSLVCDTSFQMLRGCAQILESALGSAGILFDHVPGHAGDPFNEICDQIAKQEGQKGFFLPRPQLHLATWRRLIPYLWILFGKTNGVPTFQGTGFNVQPPDLPPAVVPDRRSTPRSSRKLINFAISIATGNVQSLGLGTQGFTGKLQYLRTQFAALKLNFIGLQETRSPEGLAHKYGILRLSSGSDNGQAGVELWCNLQQPIATATQKQVFLQRQHFLVVHRDPRRLLVRIQHPLWEAWILVAYAPHSGYSDHDRAQWWSATQTVIQEHHTENSPLLVCIDANAGPGEPDGEHFFQDGFRTSSSTKFLQAFVSDFHLCAPITSSIHEGSTCTWTSPLYEEFTIDYVLIPQTWMPHCSLSKILEEFDLGNQQQDHSVYALELKWQEQRTISTSTPSSSDNFDRTKVRQQMPSHFEDFAIHPWETNVEEHLQHINDKLHMMLQRHCHRPQRGPERPYVDEQSWKLRKAKLHHRSELKHIRHLLRRESLARVLAAWKNKQAWDGSASFNFGSTLLSGVLKHGFGFRVKARALREHIRSNKKAALHHIVSEFNHTTAASEIQQRLKPFMGPSNKLRQGMAPLPLIKDADGIPCTSHQAALDRWISFFSEMEGGERVDAKTQRDQWRENLENLRCTNFDIEISEVPSLAELEQACRQVAAGKASGMDRIPSELLRYCPRSMASTLYSLMLKVYLQGQEPLAHKGGFLVPIWKGTLSKDVCGAFRSILISSMVGKTLHKAMRTKQSDLYHSYLHAQQLGGRKGVSVSLGGHLIRAFLRIFKDRNQPTAVLFIDLQEAFYRVIRPLAISGHWDDAHIASIAARLHLDHNIMHDLKEHLLEASAIDLAGMKGAAKRAIKALHTDTFFALPGQHDVVRTSHGSRPGDSFADVVFGYLMARVLKSFEAQLATKNILSCFPDDPQPDFHEKGFPDQAVKEIQMVGPCWMDDLAIPLTANTNAELLTNLGVATSMILDLFQSHAMTPNLHKGKTEILFKPRGRGSKSCQRQIFGPNAPRLFTAIGEYGTYKVNIVTQYLHLGGTTHFSGDLRKEIKRRIAISNQSFNKHRKLIYQNTDLAPVRRTDIFNSLILSRLLFGAETWFIQDQKTKDYLHSAIMRLYKRLLRCPSDSHVSDEEVLHRTELPAPSTLLRLKRLSYLSSLIAVGHSAHWGLLNQDKAWMNLLRDDLQWVWDQLSHSCNLGNPFEHTDRWLEVIRHHRSYWRRLLRRAKQHSILVASRHFVCVAAHLRIQRLLSCHSCWKPQPPEHGIIEPNSDKVFGCMSCELSCRTLAGEGAHMNRKHGQFHPVRTLIDGTQCGHCLKEFFTHGKLQAHLIRSDVCRHQLVGRKIHRSPLPGLGSTQVVSQHEAWDGRLPVLQAEGPRLEPVAPRDFDEEHPQLSEDITLLIVDVTEETIQNFEGKVRSAIKRYAISWTLCRKTLSHVIALLDEADLEQTKEIMHRMRICLTSLCSPCAWPFLQQRRLQPQGPLELAQIEKDFDNAIIDPQSQEIPRPRTKERIFLHVFSGRRREGDLQFFIEKLYDQICTDSTTLCVVSVDLIIDQQWGNVRQESTQSFWLEGVRAGWVCGALCGPPCETWSQARYADAAADHRPQLRPGPRPLRDVFELWGFSSLSLREALQVATGNELLLFSMELLFSLACVQGFGVLEHPQEPEDETRPSIWRLAMTRLLMRFPGVELIDLAQGLLGAWSPKPTRLLALNLPTLRAQLREHQISKELPKRSAIGKGSDGSWKTSPLKEYPPAMNRALAFSFCQWFHAHPFCAEEHMDPDFYARCCSMVSRTFGTTIGPDYGK